MSACKTSRSVDALDRRIDGTHRPGRMFALIEVLVTSDPAGGLGPA